MTNPDVIAYDCSQEYGNPSGHSMMATMILFIVLDAKVHFKLRTLTYVILVIFSIIWFLLMGTARVFVGVHSIN